MEKNLVKIIIIVILVVILAVGGTFLGINWEKIITGGTLFTQTEMLAARERGYAEGAGSVAAYTEEIERLNEQILSERAEAEARYTALWEEYQAEVQRLNAEIGRLDMLVQLLYETVWEFFEFDLENIPQGEAMINLQLSFMRAMKENAETAIERETEVLSKLPELGPEKIKLDELIVSASAAEEEIRVTETLRKFALENYPPNYAPTRPVLFVYPNPLGDPYAWDFVRYTFVGDIYLNSLQALGLTTFMFEGKQYSTSIYAYTRQYMAGEYKDVYTSNASGSATVLLESIWDGWYYENGGAINSKPTGEPMIDGTHILAAYEAKTIYTQIKDYFESSSYFEKKSIIDERDLQQSKYDAWLKQKTISEFLIETHTDNLLNEILPYIEQLEKALVELQAEEGMQ